MPLTLQRAGLQDLAPGEVMGGWNCVRACVTVSIQPFSIFPRSKPAVLSAMTYVQQEKTVLSWVNLHLYPTFLRYLKGITLIIFLF